MGRKHKTPEEKRLRRENEFKDKLKEKFGDEFTLISKYDTQNTTITLYHKGCKSTFQTNAKIFFRNPGCRKCQIIDHPEVTKERFLEEFNKEENSDYVLLTDFEGLKNPITIYHKACNRKYTTIADNFWDGHRCPYCAGNYKDVEIFREEMEERGLNEEYECLNIKEFDGYQKHLMFKHKICNNTFSKTPIQILKIGVKCPYCNNEMPITEEEAKRRIQEKFNGDIEILTFTAWGEYGWVHCNRCGNDAYKLIKSLAQQEIGCITCQREFRKREANLFWNGGISTLEEILRNGTCYWKDDSKKFYDNKCIISGATQDLEVHHFLVSFVEIKTIVMNRFQLEAGALYKDFTDDEIDKIREYCNKLHYACGFGVPLSKEIHQEFHKKYGTKNNTVEQLMEFADSKGVKLKLEDKKLVRVED